MSEPVPRASAAKSNVRTLPPELAEALVEGSEVNGQVLRRLRESRGLSIDELSAATHIRKPYIIALEEMSLEELPARVYLRGFLTQIARVLKVDKKRLTDGYVEFAERFKL